MAELFSKGFAVSSKSTAELLKRLAATHDTLKRLDQDDSLPAGLDNVAAGLVHATVIEHKDADVRLLAAAGLVDVLRLYAPDAPFDDEQKLVRPRATTQDATVGAIRVDRVRTHPAAHPSRAHSSTRRSCSAP
jgi:hypothetical protein